MKTQQLLNPNYSSHSRNSFHPVQNRVLKYKRTGIKCIPCSEIALENALELSSAVNVMSGDGKARQGNAQ